MDVRQFHAVFFEEATEHLASLESLLLSLDLLAPDAEQLNAIFRAAHSVKGGAATFGFADVAELTHALETLLDKLRKQEMLPTREMVDALLAGADVLSSQLAAHRGEGSVEEGAADAARVRIESLVSGGAPSIVTVPASTMSPSPLKRRIIRFRASLEQGVADNLLAELGALGELEIMAEPPAGRGARRKRKGDWVLALTSSAKAPELHELLEFVVQPEDLEITEEQTSETLTADRADPGFGFFDEAPGLQVCDAGFGFFDDAPGLPENDPGYGFFDEEARGPSQSPAVAKVSIPAASSAEPAPTTGAADSARTPAGGNKVVSLGTGESSSIRVSVEKVDQLINLVGELVITQAMLAQTSSQLDPVQNGGLVQGLTHLERNTRDLQEAVMSIRMLPIAFVFSRFPRLVHDLAAKLGKRVELKTVGEGTELDKGVIEKIADPLTHLVRNSLDHGIETPEARRAAGKPETGTITLRAFHQGGSIVIEVIDDGGGLHRDRILAKARSRGMSVEDSMSDQDVWQLIFEPGFSTAEVVSDVSGRGVGMDVVKRNIQSAGGRVELNSVQGQGTRISIRLPLTLAILDGMSIAVGKEMFILPLGFVVESLQPRTDDLHTVRGSAQLIRVRGEHLPVVALSKLFAIPSRRERLEQGIVVILESEGGKVALWVDELVGQHQVVIKSLETNYRKVPYVSGATIMGDGRVALILDVAALVRVASNVAEAA
ncbi:MAG TPA: chemotaxis protein CheW [Burkholderiales bacterium]|nr:chemotaxis protein CheW [Burkholderiales bacterium]